MENHWLRGRKCVTVILVSLKRGQMVTGGEEIWKNKTTRLRLISHDFNRALDGIQEQLYQASTRIARNAMRSVRKNNPLAICFMRSPFNGLRKDRCGFNRLLT